VISAWWIWYYGGGFGHRAFIDHYPVLLVPFALWLDQARPSLRKAALAFATVASGWHLMQFWQYNHSILHEREHGPREYAWAFMRFAEADRGTAGRERSRAAVPSKGHDPDRGGDL
jgi:hypothetical protein